MPLPPARDRLQELRAEQALRREEARRIARRRRKIEPPQGRPPAAPRRRAKKPRSLLRRILKITGLAAGFALFALTLVISYYAADLPSTATLFEPRGRAMVTIVDMRGRVIAKRGSGYGDELRLDELPPHVIEAVLATEDRRFYGHFGIDPLGLMRALFANIEAGRVVQGGSTITQQLAKNLFLAPDRTFGRKVQEALLAIYLESRFTKDEILALYLNRVYFGAGTYGIDAAARRYFGKSARDVTLIEAAMLAGLLKAPSRYSPTNDPTLASARAEHVLAAMVDAGYITEDERARAAATRPKLTAMAATPGAGWFADYILDIVPDFAGKLSDDVVIETTLDLDLQREAERAIAEVMAAEAGPRNASQAALLSMDGEGAILAMVGGRSYDASPFNRAVTAMRPPGSAFKPFVYLAALARGWDPSSRIVDEPVSLGDWAPGNFDDEYKGTVTLMTALAKSLNSVAVKLIADIGAEPVVETAHAMGITSPLMPVPALALGTSEVNLLELTRAYVPFANGGNGILPFAIVRVIARDGTVLYEREGENAWRVLSPKLAGQMVAMMREAVLTGTAKSTQLTDRPSAGKTGTSGDYRDAWFVGFTRTITTGVWVGNDDNTSMVKVTGGTLPARIWHDFMEAAGPLSEGGALIALENAPDALSEPNNAPADDDPGILEQLVDGIIDGIGPDEAAADDMIDTPEDTGAEEARGTRFNRRR